MKNTGPMNGIDDSTGTVRVGSRAPVRAVARPSPSTSATPVPRNVRARPDTIWSAWKWMHTMACSSDSGAPATIARTRPSHGLPVSMPILKPARAPTNIMPSTPRLMIPERSVKISPMAANSRMVPLATPAARMSSGFTGGPAGRGSAPGCRCR